MHNMNKVKMLDFQERGDERGHFVIAEGMHDVPFDIKFVKEIRGVLLIDHSVSTLIRRKKVFKAVA